MSSPKAYRVTRAHLVRPQERPLAARPKMARLVVGPGPRPRDSPTGPHMLATVAGPARGAARLTRQCSLVAYGQSGGLMIQPTWKSGELFQPEARNEVARI